MTAERKVLVTGATGRTGRHVVAGLLGEGFEVTALVRTPVTADLPRAVRVVEGDLRDPKSVAAAARGADAVFLMWPGFSSTGADQVVAELAAQTRHVVYLSAALLQDDAVGSQPGVWSDIEELLAASGVAWTFVRAGGFAANTLGWADQARDGDVMRTAYPEAARSLVHERDIADVVVRALADPGHVSRIHVVTGPAVLTESEQVRAIGDAIARPLRIEQLPAEVARRELEQAMGSEFADTALVHWATMVTSPERVSDDVERVTGHPARSFATWARDHRKDFVSALDDRGHDPRPDRRS